LAPTGSARRYRWRFIAADTRALWHWVSKRLSLCRREASSRCERTTIRGSCRSACQETWEGYTKAVLGGLDTPAQPGTVARDCSRPSTGHWRGGRGGHCPGSLWRKL